MVDRVTIEQRSKNMAAVRSQDTMPELRVRRILHAAGYRYRLHRKDLPGKPDLVLSRFRLAVFVNGCFWHGHSCSRGRRPTSNRDFWERKIDANVRRDRTNRSLLKEMGWKIHTVWECRLDDGVRRILRYLNRETRRD